MSLPTGPAPTPSAPLEAGGRLLCRVSAEGPGTVVEAGPAAAALLGETPDALVGQHLADRIIASDPDPASVARALASGGAVEFAAVIAVAGARPAYVGVAAVAVDGPEPSAALVLRDLRDRHAPRVVDLAHRLGRLRAPAAVARAALDALAAASPGRVVGFYDVRDGAADVDPARTSAPSLAPSGTVRLRDLGEAGQRLLDGRPVVYAGGGLGAGAHVLVPVAVEGAVEALFHVRGDEGWTPRPSDVASLADAAPLVWGAYDRARTQAECAAREAQDQRLFETMSHGVAACKLVRDADGQPVDVRYLAVNPAFEAQTGLAAGRRAGRLMSDAGLNARWLQTCARAVETSQAIRFEEYVAPVGRWFDTSVLPMEGDRFAILFDDITARREAEADRADRGARHAFLVRLNDDLRLCAGPADVLATACRLLGEHLGTDRVCYGEVADGEVIVRGDHHTDRLPPLAGRYPAAELAGAGRAPRTVVARGVPGETPPPPWDALGAAAFVGVPLVRDGQPGGVVCVASATPRAWTAGEVALVEDVAEATRAAVERAHADRAVRESEALYRLLANMAPALVWMTDPEGQPTFYNEAWAVFTGLPTDALLRPGGAAGVLHPDDAPGAVEEWHRGAVHADGFSYEYRLRNAKGAYEWHAARAEPILALDGTIAGWVGAALNVDAHRRAQDALRESAELYRILVENATEYAILAADADGKILLWSQGAERIFGYAEPDVLGEDMAILFTDEDRAAGVPQREKATAEATGRAGDDRWHVRKDRTRFFATGVLTRIDHPDGSRRGFVKVLRDNTRRKVAQDAVRTSEARFRALASAVPQIVWTFEQLGDAMAITYLNERWFGYTGQTLDEAYDGGTSTAIHPDDLGAATAGWQQALETGTAFSCEIRLRAHDGRYEWHLARSVPVVDEATGRITWYGTSTNVDAARLAEEALASSAAALAEANRTLEDRVADRTAALAATAERLRSSEARFRLLFETAPVGIGLARPDGTVVAVNPEMATILGYDAADLLGRTWHDLTHPDDHAVERALEGEIDAGTRDSYTVEKRYVRPDGSLVWARLSVNAVRGTDGTVDHLVGTVEDVSEQRGTELAALEAAEAERRRLSRDLHDDLGQRIASASMMASTIARRLGAEEHGLAAATQRLGAILQDALTLVRGFARGLAPVDLVRDGLLDALRRLCDTTTEAYDLPCTLDAPERLPMGDPAAATHLFRIAQEAVSNAARHARATSVRITLVADDGRLVMDVEDDGVGIPPGTLADGPGLGLRSVRARAAALDGSILIAAGTPRGTRLTVTMPLPAPDDAPGD